MQFNSTLMNQTSYFFDNLLLFFVCLYFENIQADPIELVIDNALNGNYSYFIPSLQISPESLPLLSLLFSCGSHLGKVSF